eukprot:COSAG06_NODE_19957_length_816_cov_1.079498_1_plen_186_part_10
MALLKRAKVVGVTEQQLEAAETEDSQDFKSGIIELLAEVAAKEFELLEPSLPLDTAVDEPPSVDADGPPSSPGGEAAAADSQEGSAAGRALLAELSTMGLPALIQRATAAGASDAELEAAAAERDHKAILVQLILQAVDRVDYSAMLAGLDNAKATAVRMALREELSSYRLMQLLKRAVDSGVGEE